MENEIGIEEPVEQKASEITVQQLEDLFKECLTLERKHNSLKEQATNVWHDMTAVQLKIGVALEKLGRTDFSFSVGKFSYSDEQNDLTPKTLEQKNALKEYMISKGLDYDAMTSINAQTLKSFCKRQRELAEENGEVLMQIPGIELGAVTRKFKMKQTKEF